MWVGGLALLMVGSIRRRFAWTGERMNLTMDLVERMVGHRTRLVQEDPSQWHRGEDQGLQSYLEASRAMDHRDVQISVFLSRGWMIPGLLGLAPAFLGGQVSLLGFAVGLGGVMMAAQALTTLAGGISLLGDAWIAWDQVGPLYRAAALEGPRSRPLPAVVPAVFHPAQEAPLVDASDVSFAWRPGARPVLHGCSLRIRPGDQVLLQGPSGGGKSTLVSLLSGLRTPSDGLLLLAGLDRATLGQAGWRRLVATAPQFHDNYVLVETFAFNLLLGRAWPPRLADLEEAEALCQELGLGPLLDRMPSRLQQMVGDMGWRLSHGERSRLYIARALLQGARLVILDESMGALDPVTLKEVADCVRRRAATLVVVAHP